MNNLPGRHQSEHDCERVTRGAVKQRQDQIYDANSRERYTNQANESGEPKQTIRA
jgi:hypothetical protein